MDIHKIRCRFPILKEKIRGYPLVYLDNASTTHKPDVVIDAVADYYRCANGNTGRAVHALALRAEDIVRDVRRKVVDWICAKCVDEVIFTSGTTSAINLVMYAYGEQHVSEGDEILVSTMEHLSNWLPWHVLAKRKGAVLRKIPIISSGEFDMDVYDRLLSERTKIVAVSHVSNVLGTLNPIEEITKKAHAYGAVVVVDAAQSIAHVPVDVRRLGCDFLAFSSHKMYGPTGLGVLYACRDMLPFMRPWQFGGGMLNDVQPDEMVHALGAKVFEAGTLHLAGIAGLGEAFSFLEDVGYVWLQSYEARLLAYAEKCLRKVPGLKIWGNPKDNKVAILSFSIEGMHDLDIGIGLDARGIAVRTGKHCAIPLMQYLGIQGTVRVSLGVYNTLEDIDRLVGALYDLKESFG